MHVLQVNIISYYCTKSFLSRVHDTLILDPPNLFFLIFDPLSAMLTLAVTSLDYHTYYAPCEDDASTFCSVLSGDVGPTFNQFRCVTGAIVAVVLLYYCRRNICTTVLYT